MNTPFNPPPPPTPPPSPPPLARALSLPYLFCNKPNERTRTNERQVCGLQVVVQPRVRKASPPLPKLRAACLLAVLGVVLAGQHASAHVQNRRVSALWGAWSIAWSIICWLIYCSIDLLIYLLYIGLVWLILFIMTMMMSWLIVIHSFIHSFIHLLIM